MLVCRRRRRKEKPEKLKPMRIVIHSNADHYVFFFDEPDVENEMREFINALKPDAD